MIILEHSALTQYLKKYDDIYPGIELWWERKVVPDVVSGIKKIFRFDRNFDVNGLGVVDIIQGKLCHLSLEHAVKGSGLGLAIMNLAKREIKNNNHNELWCHGPERMVNDFMNWSGATPVKSIGNFGRTGENDLVMRIEL